MELVNCKKCGRMFGSENGQIYCSKCRGNEDEDFKKVRDYLYDNPGASVKEVSEETGVKEQTIIRFLKQERIEILEDENALLKCERCGVSIKTGRYCEKCKAEMKKELGSALKNLKESQKPKLGYHTKQLNKK
ncbi:flagellar protein [Tepidibacter thalassicus]|uniref:Flagellar operon protein TIGR03826 n=1 Tax=Tepidibacter thalassicus DSM 15285 TaxID=1123350 RepID=A0A1M5R1H6_9FIRM|nr:flagellar protein [Tepidibacter thalassicus]SHH20011.1 flagellar operon protein TIGR03826 [Tepidibacter thalassicus DSM 15285]